MKPAAFTVADVTANVRLRIEAAATVLAAIVVRVAIFTVVAVTPFLLVATGTKRTGFGQELDCHVSLPMRVL